MCGVLLNSVFHSSQDYHEINTEVIRLNLLSLWILVCGGLAYIFFVLQQKFAEIQPLWQSVFLLRQYTQQYGLISHVRTSSLRNQLIMNIDYFVTIKFIAQ